LQMRALLISTVAVILLAASPAFSDIHRIDTKDLPRAGKSLVLLYVDIGKGTFSFFKSLLMTADDVPKAILTDIFGAGRKKG